MIMCTQRVTVLVPKLTPVMKKHHGKPQQNFRLRKPPRSINNSTVSQPRPQLLQWCKTFNLLFGSYAVVMLNSLYSPVNLRIKDILGTMHLTCFEFDIDAAIDQLMTSVCVRINVSRRIVIIFSCLILKLRRRKHQTKLCV